MDAKRTEREVGMPEAPESETTESAPATRGPHDADRTHASDGRGTSHGPGHGETQDRPVLDGASMEDDEEHEVDNPWRGVADPALSRHPKEGKKSFNPYGG